MEMNQVLQMLMIIMSCLLIADVWCDEHESQLDDMAASHPQRRSAGLPADNEAFSAGIYAGDDDMDKRSSLFRFGKRGSLFRFGKRGSLFRFGKRGSLFRFGKRGTLFRFGKRDDDEVSDGEMGMYPEVYTVSDDDLKRVIKSFHWGRETEE